VEKLRGFDAKSIWQDEICGIEGRGYDQSCNGYLPHDENLESVIFEMRNRSYERFLSVEAERVRLLSQIVDLDPWGNFICDMSAYVIGQHYANQGCEVSA